MLLLVLIHYLEVPCFKLPLHQQYLLNEVVHIEPSGELVIMGASKKLLFHYCLGLRGCLLRWWNNQENLKYFKNQMRLIFLEVKKAREYFLGKYFSFSFLGTNSYVSHLEHKNRTQTGTCILEVLSRKKRWRFYFRKYYFENFHF